MDSSAIYFRMFKGATTVAYVSLLLLTWAFTEHRLHWTVPGGAVALSGFWFVLTRVKMNHLLQTYFDVLSRLEVVIPATVGIVLSLLAMLTGIPVIREAAAVELVCWLYLILLYRRNKKHFEIQGYGPVPTGCWVSPPPEFLQAGDLLLTSGRIAKRLRECVGHAEMVIQMPDGSRRALSSYMACGLVLNPLDEVAASTSASGHYIVMRPKTPFTPEQIAKSADIAQHMLEDNISWRDLRNARRQNFISKLPLSQRQKQWLVEHTHASGYDWLGLFLGRIAPHHWTCIGACIQVYKAIGVKIGFYGTGLLGVGTTLFDPIMPVRLLSDPAFYLLKKPEDVSVAAESPTAANRVNAG
jgi:hypothetical protein